MRPFVVYWNNIPTPYMVERFNALADRDEFEFEAWFNDRIKTGRSWEVNEANWRFRYRYIPTTRMLGRRQHWPLPILGRRPDVLVSLYAEPSFVAGWTLAKIRGVKTVFRVVKTYDSWVSRKRIREAMKSFLFQRVDGIETLGQDGAAFAKSYSAPADRIYLSTHTVDVTHLRTVTSAVQPQRESLRAKLGLKGATFIYVGRLWWGKGINHLIQAFETVQLKSTEPVSLLLVGDGPEEASLRSLCVERGLDNVLFAGFQRKSDLPRYYALADVFVFPTLGDPYGLVVDEAMACGLPIISTSAAGEIHARIEQGANGYIVPPENNCVLAERMLELAQDPGLRSRMGRVSEAKVQDHTPEKWAEDFEGIVEALLKS